MIQGSFLTKLVKSERIYFICIGHEINRQYYTQLTCFSNKLKTLAPQPKKTLKKGKLIATVVVAFVTLFILLLVIFGLKHTSIPKGYETVSATVESVRRDGTDASPTYATIVSFVGTDNRVHSVELKIKPLKSKSSRYIIGDSIKVAYNPTDPEKGVVEASGK